MNVQAWTDLVFPNQQAPPSVVTGEKQRAKQKEPSMGTSVDFSCLLMALVDVNVSNLKPVGISDLPQNSLPNDYLPSSTPVENCLSPTVAEGVTPPKFREGSRFNGTWVVQSSPITSRVAVFPNANDNVASDSSKGEVVSMKQVSVIHGHSVNSNKDVATKKTFDGLKIADESVKVRIGDLLIDNQEDVGDKASSFTQPVEDIVSVIGKEVAADYPQDTQVQKQAQGDKVPNGAESTKRVATKVNEDDRLMFSNDVASDVSAVEVSDVKNKASTNQLHSKSNAINGSSYIGGEVNDALKVVTADEPGSTLLQGYSLYANNSAQDNTTMSLGKQAYVSGIDEGGDVIATSKLSSSSTDKPYGDAKETVFGGEAKGVDAEATPFVVQSKQIPLSVEPDADVNKVVDKNDVAALQEFDERDKPKKKDVTKDTEKMPAESTKAAAKQKIDNPQAMDKQKGTDKVYQKLETSFTSSAVSTQNESDLSRKTSRNSGSTHRQSHEQETVDQKTTTAPQQATQNSMVETLQKNQREQTASSQKGAPVEESKNSQPNDAGTKSKEQDVSNEKLSVPQTHQDQLPESNYLSNSINTVHPAQSSGNDTKHMDQSSQNSDGGFSNLPFNRREHIAETLSQLPIKFGIDIRQGELALTIMADSQQDMKHLQEHKSVIKEKLSRKGYDFDSIEVLSNDGADLSYKLYKYDIKV
jgi:hypothetical protein